MAAWRGLVYTCIFCVFAGPSLTHQGLKMQNLPTAGNTLEDLKHLYGL